MVEVRKVGSTDDGRTRFQIHKMLIPARLTYANSYFGFLVTTPTSYAYVYYAYVYYAF